MPKKAYHSATPLAFGRIFTCDTRDLAESPLGRIINHKPADILGETAIRKRKQTAAKWSNLFPEEPFEKDLETIIADKNEFKSPFSYDILSASARQKIFYYQVRDQFI